MNISLKNLLLSAILLSTPKILLCLPEEREFFTTNNPMQSASNRAVAPKEVMATQANSLPVQKSNSKTLTRQPSKIIKTNPIIEKQTALSQAKKTVPAELQTVKKAIAEGTLTPQKTALGLDYYQDTNQKKWYVKSDSSGFFKVTSDTPQDGHTEILLDDNENPSMIIKPNSSTQKSSRYVVDPEFKSNSNPEEDAAYQDNPIGFSPNLEISKPKDSSFINNALLRSKRSLAQISLASVKKLKFFFKDPQAKISSLSSYIAGVSKELGDVETILTTTQKSLVSSSRQLQSNFDKLLAQVSSNKGNISKILKLSKKIESYANKANNKSDKFVDSLSNVGDQATVQQCVDLANDISDSTDEIVAQAKKIIASELSSRGLS